MKIGFIGLGVMGQSMALHLMEKGHTLTVYNRTKGKALPLLEKGAVWAEGAGACAKGQDAVITMVGFPQDVEQVYFSDGGILDSAQKGAYVIDMTTTSPALWKKIAEEAEKRGLHPLDAPVSGGASGAKNAALSIMVGGSKADFQACCELLSCMGTAVTWTGQAGSGQHTKMANQIAIAGCVTSVAEAIRYAEANGLDVQTVLSCISKGAAGSWQMDHNAPMMMDRNGKATFYIKHFIKDMKIAVSSAHLRKLRLPVLEEVLSMYEQLSCEGLDNEGTQSIIKWYDA